MYDIAYVFSLSRSSLRNESRCCIKLKKEATILSCVYNLVRAVQQKSRPCITCVGDICITIHPCITYVQITFCKALNDKKDVRIVFCDQSKAFDHVWHQGLLYKLECIGITGDLLSWFQSYLHRRQQRVIIHGVNSQWGVIPARVPQGATLGPMLFLIYINDITENINCNIKLFADDASLYVTVDEDAVNAANQLNDDLNQNKYMG